MSRPVTDDNQLPSNGQGGDAQTSIVRKLHWHYVTGDSANETLISASDRALAYGDGLFATMRVREDGGIAGLDLHLARLAQGAFRLGFFSEQTGSITSSAVTDALKSRALLLDIRSRLIEAALLHKGRGLKLLVSRGSGGRGYKAPENPALVAILSSFTLPAHYQEWARQGVSLASCKLQLGRQPKLAGMKHLNRLEQVLIRREALPDWADDFLVSDSNGELIESSMANLLFIAGNTCFTPHHGYAGVSGVMRQAVIEALLTLGFRVEAKALTADLLSCCDAVLMSNSLLGVINVRRIDNHHFPAFHGIDKLRDTLDLLL